jgi:hypothetical protein
MQLSDEYFNRVVTDPDNDAQRINTRIYADPITSKALSFDVAAGYYATIAHYLGRDMSNRDQFIEFSYWGLNRWESSKTLVGVMQPTYANNDPYDPDDPPDPIAYTGSLVSFFDQIGSDLRTSDGRLASAEEKVISDGFNNVLQHDLYYRSEINNFEVNGWLRPRSAPDRLVLYPNGRWRRERVPGASLSWMAGMRVMLLDELFDFGGEGQTQTATQVVDTSGWYRIHTNNDLYGFQIGGELMFRDRLWEWGGRWKLGPMINFAEQSSDLTGRRHVAEGNPDPVGYPTVASIYRTAHKYEVSGMAEIGVEGTYKITPHLTFHAAYDWLFLTGLALAPEQVDYQLSAAASDDVHGINTPGILNNNGHALYQGLTLGLEWLW